MGDLTDPNRKKTGREEWFEVSFDVWGGCAKKGRRDRTYISQYETQEESHEDVLVYDWLRVEVRREGGEEGEGEEGKEEEACRG